MATKITKGLTLIALLAGLIAPQFALGAVVWGTGVTLPSSPVYGQSNPYIYTDGAFYSSFTVDSLEIGSRHWNCGGAEHNIGYITLANASTSEVYATSSQFNQYCGGWDNPDNLSVGFSGETIPALTIVQIRIHYTTWVGDNGYGGLEMQGNTLPNIAILSPADDAEISTTGMLTPWSVYNTITSSTITGVAIYPVLQIPNPQTMQSSETNSVGTVSIPDSFSYTPQPYYAYAYAKDSAGTVLASTTPITIYLSVPEDTTTSTAYSTCDTGESGWFGRSFCKSMVFLFVPSDYILTKFVGLQYRAMEVPPFSFFGQISDALNLSATSTDQLISTSTVSGFSEAFSPLRSGIGIALWLLFAFWAIRAIRQIQH